MSRVGMVSATVWIMSAGAVMIGLAACADFGGDLGTPGDGGVSGSDDVAAFDASVASGDARGKDSVAPDAGRDNGASPGDDATGQGGDDAGNVTGDDSGMVAMRDGMVAVGDDTGAGAEGGLDTGVAETGAADGGDAWADTGTHDAGADAGGSDAESGGPDAGDAGADAGGSDAGADARGSEAGDAGADAGGADAGDAGGDANGGADADAGSHDGAADTGTDGGCNLSPTQCIFVPQTGAPGEAPCEQCMTDNGCFDPAQMGGKCETVPGNATLFGSALPDGKTCAQVYSPLAPPISETSICLDVLRRTFSSPSKCAQTKQLTPCLCGATDPAACLAGTATPTGDLYDEYACDFNSTNGATINADFAIPTYGAGIANALLVCAGAFGCGCFGP